MKWHIGHYARLLLAFCWVSSALAQNLLTNGSFEVPGPPNGSYLAVGPDSTFIDGWKAVGSAGVEYLVPRYYENFGVAQDGVSAVDLSLGVAGGLEQSFATVPGASYEVSLWVGTLRAQDRDGTAFVRAAAGDAATNIFVRTESIYADWGRYSLVFTATGAVMTLSLTTTNNDYNQFALVDNVAVFPLGTNLTSELSVDLYPGITLIGNVGQAYRIDYTTRLPTTNWIPLTYITLPTSPYLFFDTFSSRSTNRFYRAVQISGGQ
jgi:hypothetical protein